MFLYFRNFQTFDNTQGSVPASTSYVSPYRNPEAMGGSFYDPNAYNQSDQYASSRAGDGTDFDDEPPLLEELEINPQHIMLKVGGFLFYSKWRMFSASCGVSSRRFQLSFCCGLGKILFHT